jgi:hypothetical protein
MYTWWVDKMPYKLDTKQKIEAIITGIGIIILVFLILQRAHTPSKPKNIPAAGQDSNIQAQGISFTSEEEREAFIKEGWGRDPFFFEPSSAAGGIEGFVLNGIVWDAQNPYAIINDNIVKIGDKIGDMVVVGINEKSVVLEESGKIYTLQLE